MFLSSGSRLRPFGLFDTSANHPFTWPISIEPNGSEGHACACSSLLFQGENLTETEVSIPSPLISYVPILLPDELLYSFLGRLTVHNVFTNPREYLRMLFGNRYILPSVDLPTCLSSLQRTLGRQSPYKSMDHMVDAATLYPYHRPFLTAERHDRVLSILLNGGGKALKVLLGRVANRFRASPPLRYCPVCQREDIANWDLRLNAFQMLRRHVAHIGTGRRLS